VGAGPASHDGLRHRRLVGASRPVVSEILVNPELRELYSQQVIQPTYALAKRYFQKWIKEGSVKEIDPALAMRAISGKDRNAAMSAEQLARTPWIPPMFKTRETPKHLAFGQGAHYCVGAPLARLEGQIAIATLVRRMPDLRLTQAPHTLRWRPGLTVRGLEALPVAISR